MCSSDLALLAGRNALAVHRPVSLLMEKPASAQTALPGRIAAKDCLAQFHIEKVMQRRKGIPLGHDSCARSCNMKGKTHGVIDRLHLWIEKRVRIYRTFSHIRLEMTAEGLELMLQLMHQRNAVVGDRPNILSDEKRCHRSAVFERLLFSDPIFCIPKVHSQRESQS